MNDIMQELAREYRKSDKHKKDLHCDIFLIPCDKDGDIESKYIKETLLGVYDEIKRFTGLSHDEVKEWFKEQPCDTWFGKKITHEEKVYLSFYVRYDIPKSMLKTYDMNNWTQGPSFKNKEVT
ncbi:hypothetical protein VPFG_00090 [Vibrio phage nt-1]|uniref:Uncharacterized protein n=1 Tax=Vibrio phage nt-1 TaxID=115992 RepID=R9TJ23_9CAUD|nr:hypothetical protein VPFG_00090 [Vibrio phage nt-1]AGN30092.1 hypothetical protein VPFG_00090 [Vibrio phage nt-1]